MKRSLFAGVAAILILAGCASSPRGDDHTPAAPDSGGRPVADQEAVARQGRDQPNADLTRMLVASWKHFRALKITADGRVLCDEGKTKNVTFSEGQSYALLMAVFMTDEPTFGRVWEWTRTHLQRKNLQSLYWWNRKRWITPSDTEWTVVQKRLDHLFAWRWVSDAEETNSGKGGVVYYEYESADATWRDGFDVAGDADGDIALALVLAARKWHSPAYLGEARAILAAIWEREVALVDPRWIDDFDSGDLASWYTWRSPDKPGEITLTKDIGSENQGSCLRFNATTSSDWPRDRYAGLGLPVNRDATPFEGLEWVWKGEVTVPVRIQVRDADDEAYYVDATMPGPGWSKVRVPFATFAQDPWAGSKKGNGQFDRHLIRDVGFAPRDAQGTAVQIDNLRFYGGQGQAQPYLSAGDKYRMMAGTGRAVGINPSYLAPYAFRVFAQIDRDHDWGALVKTSYAILRACGQRTFQDSKGAPFKGVGLPPNWVQINGDGSLAPQQWPSWRDDFHFNYRHWDAFRTLFRVALDHRWFSSPEAKEYLTQSGPRSFLLGELQKGKPLLSAYLYDGRPAPDAKALPATTAVYAAFLGEAGNPVPEQILSVSKTYQNDGYWGTPQDEYGYFGQSWTWFALALLADAMPLPTDSTAAGAQPGEPAPAR